MLGGLKTVSYKLLFHNISIRSKLMIYFLVLVFIPLTIIMAILYSKSTQIIAEKIDFSIKRSLVMAEDNMKSKFEEAYNFSSVIYFNDEFQDILSNSHTSDTNQVYENMASINTIISNQK